MRAEDRRNVLGRDRDVAIAMVDICYRYRNSNGPVGAAWLANQVARELGLSVTKERIYRMRPLALELSGEMYPGWRLTQNHEDGYRMVTRLAKGDVRKIRGDFRCAKTKLTVGALNLDVADATRTQQAVRQLAGNVAEQMLPILIDLLEPASELGDSDIA